jgi:outer membrane lipoprotein-sorting protein
MPKRLPSLFFILSFFLIFPGCATKKTPIVNHISKNNFPPPHIVLEKIDRDDQNKGALKAIAYIEVNTFRGRYPLKAAVMVKKPSSLRLEVLPLIGPPELILSVHENVLKVFLPQKGEFYIGQASEKNLGYFFPFSTVGLLIEDITSIMLGTHPPIKEKSLILRDSPEDGFYRLDILSEKRKIQSLLIDSENNRLLRVDLFDNNNNRRYSVRFFGHSVTEILTIPDKITLASGDNENPYIIIRYSDAQMATGADAASFDLQPPPNITTISMD